MQRSLFMATALIALAANVSSGAQPTLLFSDLNVDVNGNNTTGTYNINQPFIVHALVNSPDDTTSNRINDIGYFLKASTANVVTLNSRDTEANGTQFTETLVEDPTISNLLLNPGETFNLGGSLAGPTTNFVSAGSYELAKYTFTASAAGTYTISFDPKPQQVYQPATGPGDQPFGTNGTYVVTIVPEPASLGLLAMAAAAVLRPRRRAA